MLLAGRMASLVPMIAARRRGPRWRSAAIPFLAPVSAVLAVGVGRKILKDDKARQVAYRRQQAKVAVRRYVDEVAFAINKQARDTLRQTQRVLRDEFTARASVHPAVVAGRARGASAGRPRSNRRHASSAPTSSPSRTRSCAR